MRRHLSYANVTATLALFVALGGSSYAALKLPKNSVTSKQVKNGSLLKRDFKTGQLPRGARGLTGPIGQVGPQGPAGAKGADGAQGAQGLQGIDGSAKAYAHITGQGGVVSGSKGIATANITPKGFGVYCINGLSFTPRVSLVQPDVLSNDTKDDMYAEVQTPADGTGGCSEADQVYVRISYMEIDGAQDAEQIVRTGQNHAFYIEIN